MTHLLRGEILTNSDSDYQTEIGRLSDYSLFYSDESEQKYSLTSKKKSQSTSWSLCNFISNQFDFDSGINEGLNIDDEPIDHSENFVNNALVNVIVQETNRSKSTKC